MITEDKDCKLQVMMLPSEIWNKIFYFAFIGAEYWMDPDIDTLASCRRVCREWSQIIKRSVWQRPNKAHGSRTAK